MSSHHDSAPAAGLGAAGGTAWAGADATWLAALRAEWAGPPGAPVPVDAWGQPGWADAAFGQIGATLPKDAQTSAPDEPQTPRTAPSPPWLATSRPGDWLFG
ncbi:hypothetical protein ACQW02_00290 [Humitalea sp. 24SJ18S-53]|uniref:hypothetical protein n=1 Tax=Humitalea sp. 24SJ18S-53 TaxID=3422307 RepID=UPI003D6760AC